MKFDTVHFASCLNQAGTPCTVAAAPIVGPPLIPPDETGEPPWIEVRPAVALVSVLGSVQFSAVLHSAGTETVLNAGVTWTLAPGIGQIGAASGSATGTTAGIATVTAAWDTLTGFAQLEVMADDENCDTKHVHMMICLDVSSSMMQAFDGYGTKLNYAKYLISQFASTCNFTKDQVGLAAFSDTARVVTALSDDDADLQLALPGLTGGGKTDLALGVQTAVGQLGFGDKNVLILITDGFDSHLSADTLSALSSAIAGRNIIPIVVGIRSHGLAYDTLVQFARLGGYFLSAYPSNATPTNTYLQGLRGYFCAGNCAPLTDGTYFVPKLNYTGFANWDVEGAVDLIGLGSNYQALYDLVPGNGMYVDLAGSPGRGTLTSKATWTLDPVRDTTIEQIHMVSVWIAGNQRDRTLNSRVRVSVLEDDAVLYSATYAPAYKDGFTLYTFQVQGHGGQGRLKIEQLGSLGASNDYGNLLKRVKFALWDGDGDSALIPGTETVWLDDDFDTENAVTFESPCAGAGAGSYLAQCYGHGCLTEPPPQQSPDPNPITPNE